MKVFAVRVPARCRFIMNCLRGRLGETEFTLKHGWWRYADINAVTGRSSAGVRLRELRRLCPGVVLEKKVKVCRPPWSFSVFQLHPDLAGGLTLDQVQDGSGLALPQDQLHEFDGKKWQPPQPARAKSLTLF